jgi:hypothetical protein
MKHTSQTDKHELPIISYFLNLVQGAHDNSEIGIFFRTLLTNFTNILSDYNALASVARNYAPKYVLFLSL